MIVNISKWGNSHAIRLPKELMEQANLDINDKISVSINGKQIILKKLDKTHSTRLAQRFQNYHEDFTCQEANSGRNVGKEAF